MSKKRTYSVIGIVAVALIGLGTYLYMLPVSMEKSQEIAQDWITYHSPTYTFDGAGLELRNAVADTIPSCDDCYSFVFTFTSTHGGYGSRKDSMNTEVMTPHLMIVRTEDGDVAEAVTDGYYNELTDSVLNQ